MLLLRIYWARQYDPLKESSKVEVGLIELSEVFVGFGIGKLYDRSMHQGADDSGEVTRLYGESCGVMFEHPLNPLLEQGCRLLVEAVELRAECIVDMGERERLDHKWGPRPHLKNGFPQDVESVHGGFYSAFTSIEAFAKSLVDLPIGGALGLEEEVLLGAEVVVQKSFRYPRCAGDSVHRRALKSLRTKDFSGCIQNFPYGTSTARTAADLSRRAWSWEVGFHETGPRVQIIASNTLNTPLGAGFPCLQVFRLVRLGCLKPLEVNL